MSAKPKTKPKRADSFVPWAGLAAALDQVKTEAAALRRRAGELAVRALDPANQAAGADALDVRELGSKAAGMEAAVTTIKSLANRHAVWLKGGA